MARCRGVMVAACLFTSLAASAQSYRCSTPSGTLLSDRPCRTAEAPTHRMGAIAGTPEPYRRGLPVARTQEAPAHYAHLSPACQALADAQRTAGVRGLSYESQRDLQRASARA